MQFVVYILVYPFLWLLSILPFRILYLFSDVLCFILYRLIGYRKALVLQNLRFAFPDKSDAELNRIRKRFYSHFVDVFIEIIKSISMSEKQVRRHFKFENVDLIRELGKKNKSIILLGGHYANWEWLVSLNNLIPHQGYAVYTPVGNKYFDRMMKKKRSKYGGIMVKPSLTRKTYTENEKNGVLSLNALVSDQSPQLLRTRHWATFLNVFVPIHVGAEQIAKDLNQAVVMYKVKKLRRGFYSCTFELMTENPNDYPNYELTELYLKEVEQQIYEAPEYYFWTHNRFKHRDKYQEFLSKRPNYRT